MHAEMTSAYGVRTDLNYKMGYLNRVQFETRRFQLRISPSGRPWEIGTTGFKLDAV
jgi:hypothetical protein